MKRKLTLKSIAKELGVSISTVSKALRDSPEISEETREKIKAYAKLYNYKPNNIALSLKNRKTNTIGVIIPQIVHHFFTTVIYGIEQEARENNYNVIICLSNNAFDKEVLNMELLANGSTDGFILSVSKETMMKEDYHHLNEVIDQGMPVVMFDRVVEGIQCDRVLIDDKAGAKKGVSHMIRSGCRKIGIITSEDYVSVGRLRTEGYLDALDDFGIKADDNLILKLDNIDDLSDKSKKRIEDFITNNDLDGVFTVNELFAVHASRVINALGKKIPDDISLVCFTDGQLSEHAVPSLTAVSQHGEEMGRKAASILINKLESAEDEEEEYSTTYIDTSLVERESTKEVTRR
ncbi:LacI family DNA-binding transcriptional regulator [Leeuwenhoekiella blandensis]|uniref:Putative LacI-family transcriptional regulator n=1 Tax=Leeuwenhoekiella blandensis (strain CECT 7118 / CCUG 51940 / KCTC 22103 / MED217) TaxID=398720 RepID=A3XK57_LEEBM|nr:LacI family DNA-binding transcriptional regulator [Leeuwenhoekiella blandensis]EAQ50066.1 putative LacI-family transcriptional regulator [Leeuwenhoekiella blandensis MED217]HBT09755.1 LacI family transcriptional regulator [Leeuwenhoekiella sp.]|tara:strand:+ start:8757 stop:9803 length:1047 start_codon:yes stop_codon:yes gene_type:complete